MPEQRLPCKPLESTMMEQVATLKSMEDGARAEIHTAAHGGPYAGTGGYFLKEIQPMECMHWRRQRGAIIG